MKSRETLIRLKKFQVDEKRRRVAQIEGMIADFQRMSVDLEREIQTEQDRAGINDPTHFAYPTYAKAAIQRRENLTRSADELRIQLEDAKSMLTEAFEELKKVELLDERDQARERAEVERPRASRSRQYRPDARPHRGGCLDFCFDAFSLREPVSTALENAMDPLSCRTTEPGPKGPGFFLMSTGWRPATWWTGSAQDMIRQA